MNRVPRALRIATFNLESLGRRQPAGSELEERIATLRPQLLELRADVLCLQEVDAQKDGSSRALRALDRLIERTPYAGFARAHTKSESGDLPRDVHNLVTLSRFPILESQQTRHELVQPPAYHPVAAPGQPMRPEPITWDRPLLCTMLDLGAGRRLTVLNLHLRAPLAAFIPGEKRDATSWKHVSGWAEGLFVAAVKQAGQALEARLLIDAVFDQDPKAWIIGCGDLNSDGNEMPSRILRGDPSETGNPELAARRLIPVETEVPEEERYSLLLGGRHLLPDHILLSPALARGVRSVTIGNRGLADELASSDWQPGSFHAPILAEIMLPQA